MGLAVVTATTRRAPPALDGGERSILDFGANAADIGPAVNLALAQVLADLGGTVRVPRRPVASGNPFWSWSTLAQVFGARSKRLVLRGDEGGTYCLVGGQCPFSCGVLGEIHVDQMVFIGQNTNAIDCPSVVEIGETRKAEI